MRKEKVSIGQTIELEHRGPDGKLKSKKQITFKNGVKTETEMEV